MKTAKWKMILASLLAATLAMTGTACASPAASSEAPGSQAEASGESSQEEQQEQEEPANLIWYIVGGGESKDHDMVMEELNKLLVEKINVTLDLRCLGWGEYDEQMKLISTSQEDYDLCFTSNWTNSFTDNLSRDGFLDITELYEEYGQDIAAQLPSWVVDVGRVGGRLYAIPNFQGLGAGLGVCIQKDLADKYNIEMPEVMTLDDLEATMDVIVQNEPDMIPLSHLNHYVLDTEYEESFANGFVYVDMDTFTCVGADVADEAELRLRNEWYQKGYIREDIATNSDESPYFAAKKFALLMNGYKEGVEAEYKASYGIDWVQSKYAEDGDYKAYVSSSAGAEAMTAINVGSENPEAAMKLLNLVYTDKEVYNMLVFGLEGVHYNKTGENSIELIVNEDNSSNYSYPDWELGNVFVGYRIPGKEDVTVEEKVAELDECEVSKLRGFAFDPTNVQSELAQLSAVSTEFANMEYVTDDIDQLIADRNAKLKNAGLDRVVAEVQSQIDAWLAEHQA